MNTAIRVNANEIYNPAAYERGITASIRRNATTRRSREWLAVAGNSRLADWLNERGEFQSTCACGRTHQEHYVDGCYKSTERCREVAHPAVRGMYAGDFGATLLKMRDALEEWGSLTERQTAVVNNALARTEKRIAERTAARAVELAADREGSKHVGSVGERREFTLKVERVFSFESAYGVTYINICRDTDGNVVVYKGSNGWERGEELRVKATVKAHDHRDGVAQTLIQRPTTI
jgi:hypothetical protein